MPPRDFRDAWSVSKGAVAVDMPKALEIHRERLRKLRAPLLAELDVEYQRADESGDKAKKSAIASRKQALRDMTKDPAITSAATPQDLAKAIPSALSATPLI